MSLRQYVINKWLRLVEKPKMQRAQGPEPLRRNLEFQAKVMFFPPRGTTQVWETLNHGAASVPALRVTPKHAVSGRVVLYIHGGGFVFGSPRTHAAMAAQLGRRIGAEVAI